MDEAERFRLQLLLSRIQMLSDQHWRLLEAPVRTMDGHAWVGGSAKNFDADLRRSHVTLQKELRKAVESVQAKLNAATPTGPLRRP